MKNNIKFLSLLFCAASLCGACNDISDAGMPAPARPMIENDEYHVRAEDITSNVTAFTLRWINCDDAKYIVTLSADIVSLEETEEASSVSQTLTGASRVTGNVREMDIRLKSLTDLAVKAGADLMSGEEFPMKVTIEALQADGTPFKDYGTFDTGTYITSADIYLFLGNADPDEEDTPEI